MTVNLPCLCEPGKLAPKSMRALRLFTMKIGSEGKVPSNGKGGDVFEISCQISQGEENQVRNHLRHGYQPPVNIRWTANVGQTTNGNNLNVRLVLYYIDEKHMRFRSERILQQELDLCSQDIYIE